MLVLDVDGTLTDGAITLVSNNLELKSFSVKDGLILDRFSKLCINVLFLTGRSSEAVQRRAAELNCDLLENISNKMEALREYLTKNRISLESTAYIGDDLNDYSAMKLCGFKSCPSDAAQEIREICDYISPHNGGHGAVRDICEHILKQEGKYNEFLAFYGVSQIPDRSHFSEFVQKNTRSSI